MTKSFKMILAKPFIQNGGLCNGLKEKELAFESYQLLKRMPELFTDVQKQFHPTTGREDGSSDVWLKYWRENPVNAWIGGNKKNVEPYFILEEGVFKTAAHIPAKDADCLAELLEEIIEYRFQQYLDAKNNKLKRDVGDADEKYS